MFTVFKNLLGKLGAMGRKVASLCYAGLVLVFQPVVNLVMRAVRKGNRLAGSVVYMAKRFGYVGKRFGYKRAFCLAAYRMEQYVVESRAQIKKGFIRLAPAALAVAIVAVAIHGWTQFTLAYEVNYDGNNIGYVTSETVVENACQLVKERVVEDDFSAKSVTYSLKVVSEGDVNNANEICDNIISVSNEIEMATGFYVDGQLIAVAKQASMIEQAMAQVVARYSKEIGEETVSFANEIEYIGGVYPSRLIQDTVSSDDLARVLTVMKTAVLTYTEELPFTTKEVKDTSRYMGYRRVVTKGVKGQKKIVAEVSYVNGKEVKRTIVSENIVRETVNQTVVVGAKPYTKASNTDTGTTLFWPVAGTNRSNVSAYFGDGRNHKGTADIWASVGTPIYAAEAGVVTEVGEGSGYGKYFIINHGNGLSTLYSHCSVVGVTKGQKVVRGDHVAAVGTTGRVTGPHLHFEVRINGTPIDGRAYLGL